MNANGHERKGARTSGVASSSWPSRDGAAAHVTVKLNRYAKRATQGGRLWPAGFCVTLLLATCSHAPASWAARGQSRNFRRGDYDNVSTGTERGRAARGGEHDSRALGLVSG